MNISFELFEKILNYLKQEEGWKDNYECLECHNNKDKGHHPNCTTGQLIKELEEIINA